MPRRLAHCIIFQPNQPQYQPGPAITILGDMDEVRAAVSNLIDNAVKYSGSAVSVRVETAPVDGKFVTVCIKDQGVGIPKIELAQISQALLSRSRPVSGAR